VPARAGRLVVVLGYSGRRDHGDLHPICRARLDAAARIVAGGDTVLLSGWARGRRPTSEAELMARSWRGSASAVVTDERARTTAENAAYAAELARELTSSDVVVVTSRWHAARAALLFRAMLRGSGTKVAVVPAGSARNLPLVARELVAVALVPVQLALLRFRRQ